MNSAAFNDAVVATKWDPEPVSPAALARIASLLPDLDEELIFTDYWVTKPGSHQGLPGVTTGEGAHKRHLAFFLHQCALYFESFCVLFQGLGPQATDFDSDGRFFEPGFTKTSILPFHSFTDVQLVEDKTGSGLYNAANAGEEWGDGFFIPLPSFVLNSDLIEIRLPSTYPFSANRHLNSKEGLSEAISTSSPIRRVVGKIQSERVKDHKTADLAEL